MTKCREPGTLADALDKIRGDLTRAGMAEAVGKSESLVQRWTDPDMPEWPNFQQCLKLDQAWVASGHRGHPPIFAAYERALGIQAGPVGHFKHWLEELGDVSVALGQFASTAMEAYDDGRIEPHERRDVAKARENLIREAHEVEAAGERHCQQRQGRWKGAAE